MAQCPGQRQMLAAADASDDQDRGVAVSAPSAFPRLDGRRRRVPEGGAEGQVLLQMTQRQEGTEGYEVRSSAESGGPEIQMSVNTTAIGSWLDRDVLIRSPWLASCLAMPEGSNAVTRRLGGPGSADDLDVLTDLSLGVDDAGSSKCNTGEGISCRRVAENVLDLELPSRGPGRRLLTPRGLTECLELCAPGALPFDAPAAPAGESLYGLFMWASVLELDAVAAVCRGVIAQRVDAETVALALAVGHMSGDAALLRSCYWCVRAHACVGGGVLPVWLSGAGPVQLLGSMLCHKHVSRTPLCVLKPTLLEDLAAKEKRWHTPTDCYTLCQLHRTRQAEKAYPHIYELRLDHSDEVVLRAIREDEQGPCRIFGPEAEATTAGEHCEQFLGTVVPNFWGTTFTLYDNGVDLEALLRRAPGVSGIPLWPRAVKCTVGYETNILANKPRKVTLEFEREDTRYRMENLSPRWDKKRNSYALSFFGRVKKASAKNFQLIAGDDVNTIYLMFGKISKDVFCLDYRGPIPPLAAMATAIAALAKKRAVS